MGLEAFFKSELKETTNAMRNKRAVHYCGSVSKVPSEDIRSNHRDLCESCVPLTNPSRALVEQPACSVTQPYHVQQLDAQLACSALAALSSLFLGSRGLFQSLSVCTGLLLQPRQVLP